MPRGGARPNSGPKKGAIFKTTIKKQMIRDRIAAWVEEHLDELLQGLHTRALGCKVLKTDNKGEEVYIDYPPDPQAAKILIEHAAGKPIQPVEGPGEGGEFIFKWQ